MSFKSWTISAEGNYKPTDTNGQKVLILAYLNQTALTFQMRVATGTEFSGSGYVTSISIETPVDDKVAFSVEAQGTGALSVPA
ncbi:MAG: phage tail tube protein [Bacillota bacterium]